MDTDFCRYEKIGFSMDSRSGGNDNMGGAASAQDIIYAAFWYVIDALVPESQIVIDRLKAYHRPRFPEMV